MNIIKNCKKIIITDATINKNVLNLISTRKKANKTVYIENTNQKFSNIEAKYMRDEEEFLNIVRKSIENKEYFLFGCDGCSKVEKICKFLMNEYKDQQKDFILITGNTTYRPTDASKEFKNKYVFYSPSITTGVNFFIEERQKQFIYITKRPQISPVSIYQMASRTRNMKELIIFDTEKQSINNKYKSLKECRKTFKQLTKANLKLLSLSKSANEEDEYEIIENTFFKLYTQTEYDINQFNTNYSEYLQDILKLAGFKIKSIGEYKILPSRKQNDIDINFDLTQEQYIEGFVNIKFNHEYIDETNEEVINERLNKEYRALNARTKALCITELKQFNDFKQYCVDDFTISNYFSVLNLFKTEEYIDKKITEINTKSFNVKNLDSSLTKIKYLTMFEKNFNITRFDFNKDNITLKELNTDVVNFLTTIFRRKTSIKYQSKQAVMLEYVSILRKLTGNLKFISSSTKSRGDRSKIYKCDDEKIKEIISLSKIANPALINFNHQLIKKLTGIEPDDPDDINKYIDVDEHTINTNYLFGKTKLR